MTVSHSASHEEAPRQDFVAAAGSAFSARFLSEADCARWVAEQLHPGGPSCPGCALEGPGGRGAERFYSFQRVECPGCGRFYTAASGTWLAGAKLSPRKVMLLAALIGFDTEISIIARAVEVSEVTVRAWQKKLQVIERVGL